MWIDRELGGESLPRTWAVILRRDSVTPCQAGVNQGHASKGFCHIFGRMSISGWLVRVLTASLPFLGKTPGLGKHPWMIAVLTPTAHSLAYAVVGVLVQGYSTTSSLAV